MRKNDQGKGVGVKYCESVPASDKGAAGFARVDCELADWLTDCGHPCRPSRVAGWRAAGLLPKPTGTATRTGDHPGRAPATWTNPELADVHTLALRLVTSTGRGSSTTSTALSLAGEGLPIPPLTVLAAARDQLKQLRIAVHRELGIRSTVLPDPEDSPEAVAAVVDRYVTTNPSLEGVIKRRLGDAPTRREGADAQSVVTLLAEAALGSSPDPRDTEVLDLTLRAFGLHGLVERVGGDGGPQALPGGPSDAGEAIGFFSLPRLEHLLVEMRPEDVHPGLRATRELGLALAAVPAAGAHFLGSTVFAQFLTDNSSQAVVLRLISWQALKRSPGGTGGIAQIVEAIREQGWLQAAD